MVYRSFLCIERQRLLSIKETPCGFCQSFHSCGPYRALIAAVGQLVTGRIGAETVARYQPTKLVAMEGHFPFYKPADMYLFGYADEKGQEVRYGIKITRTSQFFDERELSPTYRRDQVL